MTNPAPVTQSVIALTTTTVTIPAWATRVDLVLIGGGGGGQGGTVTGTGNGGYGGSWRGYTVDLETWLDGESVTAVKVEVRVGDGGKGGNGSFSFSGGGNPSAPGTDTTATLYAETASGRITYPQQFYGLGGKDTAGTVGNMSQQAITGVMVSQGAQGGTLTAGRDLEYNNAIYVGGNGTGPNGTPGRPGAGGSGGNAAMGAGQSGAAGIAHVRAYVPAKHLKINVFECVGTAESTQTTPYKIGLDRRYFTHTRITDYPNNIALGSSVAQGINAVVDAINANPGRFVLVGTSQGAQIMSEVFKLLRVGAIPGRLDDLLGVFSYGNPCREAGRSFPNGAVASGHGIVGPQRRLTNTPELFWEFAQQGDPICAIGDSAADLANTQLYELLMGQTSTVIPISLGLTAVTQLLTGMQSSHTTYNTWNPLGDGRSSVQVGIDQCNMVIGPAHEFDYVLPDNGRDGAPETFTAECD